MDRRQVENFILSLADMVYENRELRRENSELKKQVEFWEDDLRKRLKDQNENNAELLKCLIKIK